MDIRYVSVDFEKERFSNALQKATLHPHELASAVAPDWEVAFDEDSRGWRTLTGSTANAPRSFLSERLAVVRRRG